MSCPPSSSPLGHAIHRESCPSSAFHPLPHVVPPSILARPCSALNPRECRRSSISSRGQITRARPEANIGGLAFPVSPECSCAHPCDAHVCQPSVCCIDSMGKRFWSCAHVPLSTSMGCSTQPSRLRIQAAARQRCGTQLVVRATREKFEQDKPNSLLS
jgi:hypothetical protein